jgi:tetratricopeptide (TPR) repeat protein
MAVFQSEDRLRLKRIKAEQAIAFAMKNRWAEAADVNRRILELFPTDVDSHNRLGKALMELGQYAEARAAYEEAVRLDPTNTIAQKNLQRLEKLVQEGQPVEGQPATPAPTRVDPSLFIEESGKTAVTTLVDVAPPEEIARLTPGDTLELDVVGKIVRLVEPGTRSVVGRLEPKLNQRVLNLVEMGNGYTAAVTAVDDSTVRVILREAHRVAAMGNRPSFPTAAGADAFRGYTRDDIFRADLEEEEEEFAEEAEAETEAPLAVDLSAEEPLPEEPDLADEG